MVSTHWRVCVSVSVHVLTEQSYLKLDFHWSHKTIGGPFCEVQQS